VQKSNQDDLERLILGVDPGSVNLGYALIRASFKKFKIVDAGTLKLSSGKEFFSRIKEINTFFHKISEVSEPFELAMESLIHVKNVNSLAKLAQARGALIGAVSAKSLGCFEYAPNLIKSTVSGYGLSNKTSVEKSIGFVFPDHKVSSHDESDALAVALCHAFSAGHPAQPAVPKAAKRARTLKESFRHLKVK